MDIIKDLETRNIVKQVTSPELGDLLRKEPVTLYAGFDPTADSLHVGSMFGLITLRRFQMAGHRPIAVVGGATGMIGDPSGKSQERSLLTDEVLQKNLAGIGKVMEKFLDFSGKDKALKLNNGDWFKGFSYLDFLRDVGKHFTVNHMMAKESVRARLEDRDHGISYTEFSYMLLQAYDFFYLMKTHNCRLQIGGSDQWGNITAGCELIRRMAAALDSAFPEVFGLTHPLVMKADGTKFGKSEQGTIWLDAEKTSPYHFYQFFIQTPDADIGTLLRYFSFKPMKEIEEIEVEFKKNPAKRLAQISLAQEMTALVHGQAEVTKAEGATQALFSEDIRTLDGPALLQAFQSAPSAKLSKSLLAAGLPIVDLLVTTQLLPSKTAARKEIGGGGVYLNNERITDEALLVRADHLIGGAHVLLRKGKKNYFLVTFD